ncbi:MAG: sulfate adenylyltransferase subunit CysD [Pirellulaceae bacterium]|nr:sulfate adenylyltransferase subunit CysD [Pirellulaceae bacterium]
MVDPIQEPAASETGSQVNHYRLTHLKMLEAESIHIIREVVAEFSNPVMLYSVGKDSSVMVHLAMKAFYPAKPPFPLLHVDTTWKFREMYEFRESYTKNELGLDVLTHVNQEGLKFELYPPDDSTKHVSVMKTDALKQALDHHEFDAAFGGARRDEEKSRAKERVFSFRDLNHRWDPKNQRPELWNVYNTRVNKGESIRVFPLSNWTELDIWQYIHLEQIPIVPLYYAAKRPVVERNGILVMVDDDRLKLEPGEEPEMKTIRFRTLGCYPLTGAVESPATTLPEIIQEMLLATTSERQGRAIDNDEEGSMEKQKMEGHF